MLDHFSWLNMGSSFHLFLDYSFAYFTSFFIGRTVLIFKLSFIIFNYFLSFGFILKFMLHYFYLYYFWKTICFNEIFGVFKTAYFLRLGLVIIASSSFLDFCSASCFVFFIFSLMDSNLILLMFICFLRFVTCVT